ncbi:hypothetical protein [Candidatus Electronema sp. JM]|uniref:hypothetical protein n=1 Tax=Candidatus Electronema sp. JM TaxID=3401571 RepID=UPI003AA974DD
MPSDRRFAGCPKSCENNELRHAGKTIYVEGKRRWRFFRFPEPLRLRVRLLHFSFLGKHLNRNGQLIAKEAGKLYDTRSNLINRAEALKNLGMQSAKELPGE